MCELKRSKLLFAVCAAASVAACDVTEGTTSQTPDTAASKVSAPEPAKEKPTFANRGLFAERQGWKDAHFATPNETYGNLTFYYLTRLSWVASAKCGVQLDHFYHDWALGVGRRAVFRNKTAREARTAKFVSEFEGHYGPFSDDSPAKLCDAVRKNKSEKTLFGALFY